MSFSYQELYHTLRRVDMTKNKRKDVCFFGEYIPVACFLMEKGEAIQISNMKTIWRCDKINKVNYDNMPDFVHTEEGLNLEVNDYGKKDHSGR